MAATAASSSTPVENDRPVIVRVKRKASQSRLDAFCGAGINARPLNRPLIDFEKLSIYNDAIKVEELKSIKVFVRHVETVTTSEVTVDILQPFVSYSADEVKSKRKNEIRRTFKTENISSKNARFEQIWRSRKEKKDCVHGEALHDMCRLSDVCVDVEKSGEVNVKEYSQLEDCRMMSEYLPLLREVIPNAAVEIEADIHDSMGKALPDNYVYGYYAVRDDMNFTEENDATPFPLVQVNNEDYYDGPDDSEYETDDSNAENNPLNDYPDEASSDRG